MLMHRNFRINDRRDHAIHMILVTGEAVLAHFFGGVTALAKVLAHGPKIGGKVMRIALLVALQIGAVLFKVMAR